MSAYRVGCHFKRSVEPNLTGIPGVEFEIGSKWDMSMDVDMLFLKDKIAVNGKVVDWPVVNAIYIRR